MKRSLLVAGLVAALIAAWSVGRVHGQNEMRKSFMSPSRVQGKLPRRGSRACPWPKSGATPTRARTPTFTKFDPGQDSGIAHAHQRMSGSSC